MEEASSSHQVSRGLWKQLEQLEIQALQSPGETKAREPHSIFLSHSGQEKDFVRRLDQALRNVGHDPFFDIRSLPPGERFPPHILQNARECKLGVVVLSPGFLTSKWPMLELCTMHTSPHKPIILPLFFHVKPLDLKPLSPSFSVWRGAWEKVAENDPSRVNLGEWESAAIELSKIQGEVYQTHMGEEQFIEAILLRICSIIRPPLRYDISHLAGHERLTQVVAQLFEGVPATASHLKALALGFYAIGGQGKTTLCKLMVNHYTSAYAGRCALIEFPSNNCTEIEVVRQCNKALQRLTNNNYNIDDFDQCLQRMREQVNCLNVFIAIDNVWESSLELAQRILDVGFSRGSKILVTSRSGQVLSNLLEDSSYVMPLPGVNKEEACQIFMKSFSRNTAGLRVPLEDADVHDVTASFQFHGGYHPLTIHAVGASLGRLGGHDWHAAWKLKRHDFTGSGSVAEKAIKLNFDSITKTRREMFLDVALICIPMIQAFFVSYIWFYPRRLQSALDLFPDVVYMLLSAIYEREMDKHEISMTLMQLAYDGLLEFEDSEVHVHDLYKDLAAREAALSHRFILAGQNSIPNIKLAEAERVVCWQHSGSVPEYIHRMNFSKLRVLIIPSCNAWGPVYMPQLCVLRLFIDPTTKIKIDWRKMPDLSWLELRIAKGVKFFELRIPKDILLLRHLSVLVLEGHNNPKDPEGLCLDGFVNLQFLHISGNDTLREIGGLGSLIHLKRLILENLPCLLKVGIFNKCSTQLQLLQIESCDELREVAGLDLAPSLKTLVLYNKCAVPPQVHKLTACECLQRLRLGELSALPDLRRMPALESLLLTFTAMENVTVGFPGMLLQSLFLEFTDEANVITVGFHSLPNLCSLILVGGVVEEISFPYDGLPRLETLHIHKAKSLKKMDFSTLKGCGNLKSFVIYRCDALDEIDWSNLNDLTNLTRLEILCCQALEQIRGEPKGKNDTLGLLKIMGCPRLNKCSGLDKLTNCEFDLQ